MESIDVTVREGDSFDELYLAFQKPVGTPRDFSGSEVVAQIKETFGATTVVDSFGITKLDTTGHLKLALTASQTEALGRDISTGYIERDLTYSSARQSVDPLDVTAVYLWDLKELFYVAEGSGIASVTSGTVIDAGLGTNRIRFTTSGNHNLTANDIIRVAGTTVSG